jgi:stage V sporulation protein AE
VCLPLTDGDTKTKKKQAILITDGDTIAVRAIEVIAKRIGGRAISRSGGNPTPLSGESIERLILAAEAEPVLVLFDDNGHGGVGLGEQALQYIAKSEHIDVLGVLAVASNTTTISTANVDFSVTNSGEIIQYGVDKHGQPLKSKERCIYGDTVAILNYLNLPLVVGIGDIGKMRGHDIIERGAPVTYKAITEILKQNGKRKGL